ncbi:hypothetical protein HY604_01910 [Candidatus Peregrinibacteria bacterium]|nr:hypothetical protein [Candidatus Peregrinibacteria bacterium]
MTAEKKSEAEIIPKKKVIYAEIDDEISEIFDRIRPVMAKDVYIVVPKRAILFQSVVNLKILKRKAEDEGKKIYLVTNDKNGIYLAQRIGVPVYNKANSEGKPALFSTEEDEKLKITPLKASVNSVEDDAPTRLKEKKLSISQILGSKKGRKSALDIEKIKKDPEKKKPEKPKFVIISPNRHALIGLIVGSLMILLTIIYIALPGATVYLTPSASVLEKSVNITLADYEKNRAELTTTPSHMIASYNISTAVKKEITHFATGKKFSERGANASGKITIINTATSEWPLIAQTRFQTAEGLVFRITSSVTVPKASSTGPGKLTAFVVADIVDATGGIVGERGNISPSKFFLPALRDDSRSKIYAESSEPMKGGVTDFITFVTEEDIEAGRQRIKDELLKAATDELKVAVKEKGTLVGDETAFVLLEGEGAVKTAEVRVFEPNISAGAEMKEFLIGGEVSVSGVYYDHVGMLEILKQELMMKKSPQKELLRINEESTSYRIFDWNTSTGKIKITANIKGIEQFSIDPEKENGVRLLEKIRDHIAGKDIEAAKNYIQNLPEINKVEIESWPAWSPTVPSLATNIEFEIRPSLQL